MQLHRKIGVEIELLAPAGATRADLANAFADDLLGVVRKVLHQDSEPSKVPGHPIFYNLTLGFEALDGDGRLVARCVDDLTLQDDLDRRASPKPGSWRLASDDERLPRLIAIHVDPGRDLPGALFALAPLFHGQLLPAPGGVFRLIDAVGAPLAIAAPLPDERERPCEVITPPIERADRHTFEVHIFPAYMESVSVMAAAALFQGILDRCEGNAVIAAAESMSWDSGEALSFVDALALDADINAYWRQPVVEACDRSS